MKKMEVPFKKTGKKIAYQATPEQWIRLREILLRVHNGEDTEDDRIALFVFAGDIKFGLYVNEILI